MTRCPKGFRPSSSKKRPYTCYKKTVMPNKEIIEFVQEFRERRPRRKASPKRSVESFEFKNPLGRPKVASPKKSSPRKSASPKSAPRSASPKSARSRSPSPKRGFISYLLGRPKSPKRNSALDDVRNRLLKLTRVSSASTSGSSAYSVDDE